MPKPVYCLSIGFEMKEAWYRLSEDEQKNLWDKVGEVEKEAGSKTIIYCDSRWADEGTIGWNVQEYPDMEAYQKKAKALEKLNFYRYFVIKSILGTKGED